MRRWMQRWMQRCMWLWLAVMLAGVVGCGEQNESSGATRNKNADDATDPRVVASIFPLGSLAAQIVGDTGDVTVMLPAGRSPHAFELTVRQVRELAKADVLVVAGGGVDPWARRAGERFASDLRVFEMNEVVDATSEDASAGGGTEDESGHDHPHDHAGHMHGRVNPHHWLDPKHAADFVSHLGTELARDFPEHSDTLLANTEALLKVILAVDADYRDRLHNVQRRELVTFHNAFDPLAERYSLDVVAHLTPIELTPGGEVTPARLQETAAAIARHHLPVIYAEPQFPETAVAALRDRTGVTVLRLDPLGDPRRAGYDSWQAMMRSNLDTLIDGQNRQQRSGNDRQ